MVSALFLLVSGLLTPPGPSPAATSFGGDGRPRPLIETGAIVDYEIPLRPGTRREYFELRVDGRRVGVATTHVGMRGDGLRAEMRLDLFPVRTRVVHVEQVTNGGPRLVWREVRASSGRTTLVEWSADGERLTSVDWSGGGASRREEAPTAGALLPLFLVDCVRMGQFPSGAFDVFDPLAGRVEEWRASVERMNVGPGVPFGTRRLVLTRNDGTLAGEYHFLGEALVAFRLQRGGPVALCVAREAFDRATNEERSRRREEDERPSPASARRPK